MEKAKIQTMKYTTWFTQLEKMTTAKNTIKIDPMALYSRH